MDRPIATTERPFPVLVACAALLAGLLAMPATVTACLPLGTRTAVLLGEAALLAPFLLALGIGRLSAQGAFALRPLSARIALLSFLAGAALWAASAGLIELQGLLWPPPPEIIDAFRRLHAAVRPTTFGAAIATLLALAVAPAVAEELAFRGALFGALEALGGGRLAVLGSAALFGAIHASPGGYRVPFAFVVGVALGVARWRTRSTLPGLVAHALLNSITLLLAPWLDDGSSPGSLPLGLALALLLGGGLLSVLLLRALPRFDSPTPESVD